jgi:hypothetical protein
MHFYVDHRDEEIPRIANQGHSEGVLELEVSMIQHTTATGFLIGSAVHAQCRKRSAMTHALDMESNHHHPPAADAQTLRQIALTQQNRNSAAKTLCFYAAALEKHPALRFETRRR